MQLLLSIKDLIGGLVHLHSANHPSTSLFCQQVARIAYQVTQRCKGPIDTFELKIALDGVAGQFVGNRQEDAHELLNTMLVELAAVVRALILITY